jgi:hypothetical protein
VGESKTVCLRTPCIGFLRAVTERRSHSREHQAKRVTLSTSTFNLPNQIELHFLSTMPRTDRIYLEMACSRYYYLYRQRCYCFHCTFQQRTRTTPLLACFERSLWFLYLCDASGEFILSASLRCALARSVCAARLAGWMSKEG